MPGGSRRPRLSLLDRAFALVCLWPQWKKAVLVIVNPGTGPLASQGRGLSLTLAGCDLAVQGFQRREVDL